MGGFLKRNWFVCGIVGAVALGFAVPAVGRALDAGRGLSTAAVVAIFVLSGLSLPVEALGKGLRRLRTHAMLQVYVFAVPPLLFLLTGGWLADVLDGRLLVGIYALAVFPTTISSCIVLTQLAGGNAATAIFNAVLANLLGVFLSPVLLTVLLRGGQAALPAERVAGIFLALAGKVLLPFAAGQLLRIRLRAFADRRRKRLASAGGGLILLVVFLAFCRAAGGGALAGLRPAELAGPLAYLAGANVVLTAGAYGAARLLRLDRGDAIAAVFVGPQKTLAMGVPLLTTVFGSRPELLGVAMVPILFYHPWQLMTAGVARNLLARRFGTDDAGSEEGGER